MWPGLVGGRGEEAIGVSFWDSREACEGWRASDAEARRRQAMAPYVDEEYEAFYYGRELTVPRRWVAHEGARSSAAPGACWRGGFPRLREVVDMTERMGIEEHPDIAALRMRYDVAAETVPGQVVGGLTLLAGLYVAASPWIVGFNDFTTLTVNNLIAGLAVAAFALGLTSAFGRTHGLAWTTPIVGVWLIISPWVVSGDVARTGSIVSNVIMGVVVLLLGLAAVGLGLQRSFVRRRQERQP